MVVVLSAVAVLVVGDSGFVAASQQRADGPARASSPAVVPAPASLTPVAGEPFTLSDDSRIVVPDSPEAARVGRHLAGLLRPATGYRLPVVEEGRPTPHSIALRLSDASDLGAEGYRLDVASDVALLRAGSAEGLFRGVQTLRQLLPTKVEADTVQPGPWAVPAVRVVDHPRFGWRAAMLDVARHFRTVAEVKRYIDLIALYKINTLHLHLTDDQGWRLQIDGWPRLASYGGATEVGGGPGGSYTKEEYREIVRYAGERYITVVPEIDMPGHTNAALASYDVLSCDGTAPERYTGTQVGFSSLCVDKPVTYEFVDDVVGEVAALTPGPYIHVGGDESHSTDTDDYVRFVQRVEKIVRSHGKRMLGWEEIVGAGPSSGSVVQFWKTPEVARAAADRGMRVVMAPATKTYLDMKYDSTTGLGVDWAGYNSVRDSYEWDPADHVEGVGEADVLGTEAPLWSETLETFDDVEFMAFPRLPGVAERGWSPAEGRSWEEYRGRLAAQGPRWERMSVDFYRSPQVPWE